MITSGECDRVLANETVQFVRVNDVVISLLSFFGSDAVRVTMQSLRMQRIGYASRSSSLINEAVLCMHLVVYRQWEQLCGQGIYWLSTWRLVVLKRSSVRDHSTGEYNECLLVLIPDRHGVVRGTCLIVENRCTVSRHCPSSASQL